MSSVFIKEIVLKEVTIFGRVRKDVRARANQLYLDSNGKDYKILYIERNEDEYAEPHYAKVPAVKIYRRDLGIAEVVSVEKKQEVKKHYKIAIVGSRDTPDRKLDLLRLFCIKRLQMLDTFLSGGCIGPDKVTEYAFYYNESRSIPQGIIKIFIPFPRYEGLHYFSDTAHYINVGNHPLRKQAYAKAKALYDVYGDLESSSIGTRALMTRNVYEVLDEDISSPVDYLVFYAVPARDGKRTCNGGTNLAVALAREAGIPCLNLYYAEAEEYMRAYLDNVIPFEVLMSKCRY